MDIIVSCKSIISYTLPNIREAPVSVVLAVYNETRDVLHYSVEIVSIIFFSFFSFLLNFQCTHTRSNSNFILFRDFQI